MRDRLQTSPPGVVVPPAPPGASLSAGGTAIVAATGRNLWMDLEALTGILPGFHVEQTPYGLIYWRGCDIVAINDAAVHILGDVKHLASLHYEMMAGWKILLKAQDRKIQSHALQAADGVDIAWPIGYKAGTSTMLGVLVALGLGYDRVVLAGAPMSNHGHYYDPPEGGSNFNDVAIKFDWEWANREIFKDRVRSVSGSSCIWIGRPSEEWLEGDRQ